uniref:Uncharacterized protein n=1 Tax=Nelumbo nucifera TaxID=4432 RepID=A0A822XYV5_NELNU|nr:TPA_asm: hypothetical protein HUJ06_026367 [Nelumbo nucifera]
MEKGRSIPRSETSQPDHSNSDALSINQHIWSMTEFVARFDEVAKRRLDSMNQKLRDMETQMEALEADISKICAYSKAEFS